MKVEEIKIALKKNQEVNIQLTLIDDLKKLTNNADSQNSSALQSTSKATNEWLLAVNAIKEAVALAQKGISQTKELGIDSKQFENALSTLNTDLALYTKRLKAVSSI